MKIEKILIPLFCLLTAELVVAQMMGNYYPLNVGDFRILHADSISGEYRPMTHRLDVQGVDLINTRPHFRIREQMRSDDGSYEWNYYSWLTIDSTGTVMSAFGESPEIIVDLPIPTRTITADGDPADWAGADTLVTDPQGDDSPTQTGADVMALFVARDVNNLYLRMDLWDDVNMNFRNGPSPYHGRYTFRLDNDGPYDRMHLTIAYEDSVQSWSLEEPGPNDPPGLAGPDYVGVSGSVIELRVPLDLIGNPSNYSTIGGSAEYYNGDIDRVVSWDEAIVAETDIFDPPITWMSQNMANVGDTYEFDSEEMGGHFSMTLEGLSETVQVPGGTFPRCIEVKMIVTDTNGDTTQVNHYYYADGVGLVMNDGSNIWLGGEMRLELIDYSIQGSNVYVYTEPDTPTVGNALSIFGTVPQLFDATIQELYYRMGGQTTFQMANLTQNSSVYEASLPGNLITIRGIEYYVRFSNGQTDATYPGIDPANNPASIRVNVPRFAPSIPFEEMTYRMISVPLALTDPSISAVLIDDYGEYDKPNWRLCAYQEGDNSYYIEYPNLDRTFTPGTAFWLITRSGEGFDVDNGWSMGSSDPYTINLQPGWNQFGHPFGFPVAMANVDIAGNVEPPVYYNGEDYEYGVSVIEPWEGYFINNLDATPVTFSVLPIETVNPTEKFSPKTITNAENEYILQLSARVPGFKLIDTQNYIGLLKEASTEHDGTDFLEAPPIGDYVRLSVVEDGVRFAGNFKPAGMDGHHWNMELDYSLSSEKIVRIGLTETGQLSDNMEVYIFDVDYQYRISVTNGLFEVRLGKEYPVRHLQIIIGSTDYANKYSDGISLSPLEYTLYQNYPNPFNPQTTINYQTGRRGQVILEIYNILGRKIRTLVNEIQDPGRYSVTWNGLDDSSHAVAAGVYFSRITAAGFKDSKKLVMLQ